MTSMKKTIAAMKTIRITLPAALIPELDERIEIASHLGYR
jgi:hypothetical protein